MKFVDKLQSANKKCGENGATAIVVAIFTAFFGTGLFLDFFDRDDNRQGRGSGYTPPSELGFITKQTRVPLANLEGDWRFSTGDQLEWANSDFDDSSWPTPPVPSRWEDAGFKDYDGYAWYRRTFPIDHSDKGRPVYVYLGQIDDIDEVYINGHRIGGTGTFPPAYRTAWKRNRVYRVPSEILNFEADNLIAVRVYDDRLGGGIYNGDVGLYTTELTQPIVPLDGNWKFKTGDDPSWKDPTFDDSHFDRLRVPLAWDLEGFETYDGFAWYRKSFVSTPVDQSETMVLLLGKIDDTDEVFLNGQFIGSTGRPRLEDSEYGSYYRTPRIYIFPAALLRSENLLAVRVHDSRGHGGIYTGPVGIMTERSYQRFREQLEEAEKWSFRKSVDWLLGRD